jgi:hypothetical protein
VGVKGTEELAAEQITADATLELLQKTSKARLVPCAGMSRFANLFISFSIAPDSILPIAMAQAYKFNLNGQSAQAIDNQEQT